MHWTTLIFPAIAAIALIALRRKPPCQHHWVSKHLYKIEEGPLMVADDGEHMNIIGKWVEAKAKVVCNQCRSAKLVELEIRCYNDGHRTCTTKDGITVHIIE